MEWTPELKVKSLMNKMNNKLITTKDWNEASDYAKTDLKRKCMIVVDEVIDNLEPLVLSPIGTYENPNIYFWNKVKSIINEL